MKKELTKKIIKNLRLKKKKIIMCHGVFDLCHIGHIMHFREAKLLGDILVVSITTDKYVKKAPGRPFFKLNERFEFLKSIKEIDYIIESDSETAIKNLNLLRPEIYFKGKDYKNNKDDITKNIYKEKKFAKSINCKIIYGNSELRSSSNILNKIDNNLKNIPIINNLKKINFSQIEKLIYQFKKKKCLVIGDLILDNYVFSNLLGKSGKESVLNYRYGNNLNILGGAYSVAQNISEFFGKVNLITDFKIDKEITKLLKNKRKNLVIKNLNHSKKNIIKTRFIEKDSNKKILGLYDFEDTVYSSKNVNKEVTKLLSKNKFDLVVICDYGHNLISSELIKFIKSKNVVSIGNVQLNALSDINYDIDKISKLKNIIINGSELRRAMRKNLNEINLAKEAIKKYRIKNLYLTLGRKGAYHISSKNNLHCPAFSKEIIDKIGSGDTFLSIVAMFLTSNPKVLNSSVRVTEIALFVASVAVTQNLKNFANSNIINSKELLKSARYILK